MVKVKTWEAKLALVAAVLIGFFLGSIAGALITYKNVWVWDLKKTKNEIRITTKKLDLDKIKLDELITMIQGWTTEIDEIWLYYGDGLRARVMDSERPSKKD